MTKGERGKLMKGLRRIKRREGAQRKSKKQQQQQQQSLSKRKIHNRNRAGGLGVV